MRLLFLALFLFVALPSAAKAGGDLPTLRPSVVVAGGVVTLGDIFSNAGEKADVPVLRAPAPGGRLVLDAEWLGRAARAYGLEWRPLSRHDRAVVSRDSIVIGRDEVEDILRTALIQRGLPPDVGIELFSRDPRLHLPLDSDGNVEVSGLDLNERTWRFAATLATPTGTTRVAGRAFETVEVPVLARAVGRGDVIGSADIEWQTVRRDRLRVDALLDAEDMIGQAARHVLRPGVPLREKDVRRPVLVPRGAVVTMVLRTPAMSLSAQGRALEDGSDGDVIRVTNIQSNLTVKAKVEGPNLVSAVPAGLAVVASEE